MVTLQSHSQRLYEEIWRSTFADSEAFVALYSRSVYSLQRTHMLTAIDQSRSLSHVQYIPYKMRYKESYWCAGYISGAATRREQRGKGLVQHLMRAAHQQMWREGCLCAFLIPAEEWLYDFYQKMGYAILYSKRLTPRLSDEPTEISPWDAWQRYNRWQGDLAQLHPTVVQTFRQWCTLRESLALEEGGIGTFEKYQYYYFKDPLGEICTSLAIPPVGMLADNQIDLCAPFAMLRPLRIPQLLQWAVDLDMIQIDVLPDAVVDEGKIVFNLLDSQIPFNTGRYSIDLRSSKVLFAPHSSNRLHKPIAPDQLLGAIPILQHTLVYAMME